MPARFAARRVFAHPFELTGDRATMATSIKLDDNLADRLRRLASLRQRSPHWIMREAIREYVTRAEARESFREEAVASWSAYQETGRHLTAEEVRARLDTWGTDTEAEPPVCHA